MRVRDLFPDGTENWAIISLVVSLFVLILWCIITSPVLVLELTFGIFALFTIAITMAAILIDSFLGIYLGLKIKSIFYDDRIETVIKVISICGSLYSAYNIVVFLLQTPWAAWGIKQFLQTMPIDILSNKQNSKTIFNPTILPVALKMWKGIFINVFGATSYFIVNMFAPWSWISTTLGFLKNN